MKNRFARLHSAQPNYLKGSVITVELDISPGLHKFSIVGLPDKAVDEARDRVGSALKNSGFPSPKHQNEKVVVSMAPAEIKKEGAYFDLPIAIGYLLAAEILIADVSGKIFLGELALNGELKSVRGVLPLIQAAVDEGFNEVYVPHMNAKEAALIPGITIYPVKTLKELVEHLTEPEETGEEILNFTIAPQPETIIDVTTLDIKTDFTDIKGQETTKRGLEIAAAGGHNAAMTGPPGTGKTMLARAFTGILPNLSQEDMLEVTGIHSIAGVIDNGLVTHPPFRCPHHTASYVSVIGGGTSPKPGEVTLAHKGVMFLDEFPEFDKRVLESLRQPMEDRVLTIARAKGTATFPANFILVAAMNPCPCGNLGAEHKQCVCNAGAVQRYRRKISGPIMDRIGIWLTVEHIDYEKLSDTDFPKGESSIDIRDRVIAARERQRARFTEWGRDIRLNSEMSAKDIDRLDISNDMKDLLNMSARKLNLSPRAYHRVIKLARTIADLETASNITTDHILEALQYRPKEYI